MKQKARTMPCIFCKQLLDERTDKNQKPYFVCDTCGTQLFVRGSVGRRLLDDAIPDTQITKAEAASVARDLEQIYSYIEIFCEGEIIIPDRTRHDESQILFTEWASGTCERIRNLVSRAANSTKGIESPKSRERYTPDNGKARQVKPARRLARLGSSTVSNGKYS